ncbi:MBL fold metallo-hydrolase, partial [Sporofaciens musculi]
MRDFTTEILSAKGPAILAVGQAGYIIKSHNGQLLAIDLYLSNCVERVEGNKGYKRLLPQILNPSDIDFDVVICTHPHLDHFDIDAVPELLSNGRTKLFCSADCEKLVHQMQMEYDFLSITYVKSGDHCIEGDFDIMFVNCDHGAGAPDAVGVVVKVDGKTIYEAGDTCLRLD